MKCETIFYIGLGEEEKCRKLAVAVVDKGKQSETPVCADCATHCHPSRLTPITPQTSQS